MIDYCKTGTGNSFILMCVFAVLHRTINFACGGLSCFPPEQVVLWEQMWYLSMIITVDHIMMYSLVTTSHVQYLVMNNLHYFKPEHKASEHILSVNIPQLIPYTTTPRRCNLVISSLCRGILLCPLQCSRILRRSFYHRKTIMHIQSGMQENFTYPRVL